MDKNEKIEMKEKLCNMQSMKGKPQKEKIYIF